MNPTKDTLQKTKAKECLYAFIEDYMPTFDLAEGFTFGPEAWFKEYVKSETYNSLSPEHRGEAFDLFMRLKFTNSWLQEFGVENKMI